jgi:uncharacterized coiled-coil protein SlyX
MGAVTRYSAMDAAGEYTAALVVEEGLIGPRLDQLADTVDAMAAESQNHTADAEARLEAAEGALAVANQTVAGLASRLAAAEEANAVLTTQMGQVTEQLKQLQAWMCVHLVTFAHFGSRSWRFRCCNFAFCFTNGVI